jgi:hypothetical protein
MMEFSSKGIKIMMRSALCSWPRRFALVVLSVLSTAASLSRAAEPILGKLPDDYVIYAIGTYGGPKPLGFRIDNSGHDAALADVVVNIANRPVVLVLMAYEPVIWRVGRLKDTKIAGVLVSGHHTQTLGGIDKSTPKVISTNETPGKFPYFFAEEASPELPKINETVTKLLGKGVERFINKHERGVFYVGDPPNNLADVIHMDAVDIISYQMSGRLMAGNRGLDQLLNEGKLRLATREEIDEWVEKASEKYKRFNPDLKVGHYMRLGQTYTILKPLTLPDGMYGSHSCSFLVPLDVAFPGGPRGHNQFYIMDGTKNDPFNRAPGDR